MVLFGYPKKSQVINSQSLAILVSLRVNAVSTNLRSTSYFN